MSLRVVHVTSSYPRTPTDATAPFLADLLAVQRDAGWDVSVVATHDEGLPVRQILDGVPVRRVRYGPDRWEVLAYRGGGHGRLRNPAHALLLPGLVAAFAAAVRTEVRRRRPDVVHAHWLLPAGLVVAALASTRGALVGRTGGRPRTVVTLHGNDVALARRDVARPVARWVADHLDALLAVSEPLARDAEATLGRPAGSVEVARLPLAPGLEPGPFPPGPPRVLAAGRASHEKGFDVLVDALARPEAAAWTATLVTEGPERAALEAAAAPLGDRVRFLPLQPRRDLFEQVAAHHAVAVPSRSEGLGLFALEALALGRPVIASRVGGLPEVLAGDPDALVPPADPDALAAALGRLARRAADEGAWPSPVTSAVAGHRPAAVIAAHERAYRPLDPTPHTEVA